MDGPNQKAAGAVYIDIDGQVYRTNYGIKRPDVAAALGNPAYAKPGFEAEIPIGGVQPGRHSVAVLVENADKTGYYKGKAAEVSVE